MRRSARFRPASFAACGLGFSGGLRRFHGSCEGAVEHGDGLRVEGTVRSELGVELLGRDRFNPARGEGASDEGPVCFDEAEHAVDRHGGVELVTDHCDLLDDTIDHGAAVAGTDQELLDSRAHQSTLDFEVRAAAVPLGVDHVHAGGRHSEMVDVGPRARYPTVVEDPELVGSELVETMT